MIDLVSHFWAWGLSALAVGVAAAIFVRRRPARGFVARWLIWFGLAFMAGLPVAYLQLLSGRQGLWLETGLALFAAFIVGAALGALLVARSLREHEGWALGLIPLALIWWGADTFGRGRLEQEIRRSATSAAERVGGDPLALDVAGRDVLLPRDAANRDAAAAEMARIPGVRRVAEVDAPPRAAAGAHEQALAPRRVSPAEKTEPAAAAKPPPQPEPPQPPRDEATTAAAPSAPSPSGELDASACQAALSATLAEEPIQFRRGSASIRRVSTGVLDRVIRDLKRCPRAKIEVRGYGDSGDVDSHRLGRERAERVVDYLGRMGLERSRLTAAGQAAPAPRQADESRLIDFVVERRG